MSTELSLTEGHPLILHLGPVLQKMSDSEFIDPIEKKVYVYRPWEEVVCLENPETISGDPILSGFVLDLSRIWS